MGKIGLEIDVIRRGVCGRENLLVARIYRLHILASGLHETGSCNGAKRIVGAWEKGFHVCEERWAWIPCEAHTSHFAIQSHARLGFNVSMLAFLQLRDPCHEQHLNNRSQF